MEEIWKDITGYEGFYRVSNMGRVRSLTHKTGKRTIKGKMLKLTKDKGNCNYEKVCLCKNGKVRNYCVHFLVSVAFVPNPNNYPQIDHIVPVRNGGTNAASNLRWVTSKMNANNPISLKNRSVAQLSVSDKKSKSMKGKKTKKILQLSENGCIISFYNSLVDASEKTNICDRSISKVCNGKYKHSGGYKWRFVKDFHPLVLQVLKMEYLQRPLYSH